MALLKEENQKYNELHNSKEKEASVEENSHEMKIDAHKKLEIGKYA